MKDETYEKIVKNVHEKIHATEMLGQPVSVDDIIHFTIRATLRIKLAYVYEK